MPNLVGKKLDEATAILSAMDIQYEQVPYTNDGSYEEGEIVRTDPTAGTKLTVGPNQKKVTLYVATAVATVTVPDLTGKTRDTAVAELNSAGIKYTEKTEPNDGTVVAGTDPGAGSAIDPTKTTITLKVYDKYLMPNLDQYKGQPLASLTGFLDARKANFSYSINYVETNDKNQDGTIQSITQPPVNSEVRPGTNITIVVYQYQTPPEPPPPDPPTPDPSSDADAGGYSAWQGRPGADRAGVPVQPARWADISR